jgi:hypothetical protein
LVIKTLDLELGPDPDPDRDLQLEKMLDPDPHERYSPVIETGLGSFDPLQLFGSA